ncbi:MAG TPA: hypothetical protein VE733_22490 [Streptosporangiaceae bacterium]|nr:hypothetical protein [Streptosporangiaceae bacterium]
MLTTVFGFRLGDSFLRDTSAAFSVVRRVGFFASIGYPIIGSSSACLRWQRTVSYR